ncbi:MAG: ATP-binding cassette domain-containing protein [Chloroflexi bacterium]|nr:ATP-binding cassette domain-containing protein [Chloroflexota bacterium]
MLDVAITKRYPGFTLDVRFTTHAAITALIGPSGSGKSQTVRAVAGAMRPDRGRIALDGDVLFDAELGVDIPPQDRHVGYVPQNYALFPHLDVSRNVGFGLRRARSREARERVSQMIASVGLGGLEHRAPRQLSGGQQQRVALARALVLQPRMLLLDEPFAALDAQIRGALRQELADLQARLGFRALLVTHDPEDLVLAGERFVYESGQIMEGNGASAGASRPAAQGT